MSIIFRFTNFYIILVSLLYNSLLGIATVHVILFYIFCQYIIIKDVVKETMRANNICSTRYLNHNSSAPYEHLSF